MTRWPDWTPSRIAAATLFLAVVFAGCAAHRLSQRLDRAVAENANVDELIAEWGSPAAIDTLSSGDLVYTWRHPWTGSGVNYAAVQGQAFAVQHLCTIVVQTTNAGVVKRYRFYDC